MNYNINFSGENVEVKVKNKEQLQIRNIYLIVGKKYVINPLSKKKSKNHGRVVIFKGVEITKYGPIAKVKYLDTQRPGKVQPGDLDTVTEKLLFTDDDLKPNNQVKSDQPYDEFVPLFQMYLDILNTIDNKKNKLHVSHISQKEIAVLHNTSASNISKRLHQLIKYGAIEKVNPGCYKILNNSIWHTPYRLLHSVLELINEQPEIIPSYTLQANILNVSEANIHQAWAYIKMVEQLNFRGENYGIR
ncbi:hypothetical protein [Cytobacillus firmus]|uniref:hypothetical protein n=1 Tax=Cytobacillus firmus TaxID=1399 RepID=UPI0030025033